MSIDEIVEQAIQGHASIRDAIRWAMQQEREACAKVCDSWQDSFEIDTRGWYASGGCAHEIRARGDGDIYDIWKEKTND